MKLLPSDNGPTTKRLKLEQIDNQSSASIVEEITRGKIELEQEKKKAEEKIVNLEAKTNELENAKNELEKTLKVLRTDQTKKESQIAELTKTLSFYRKF